MYNNTWRACILVGGFYSDRMDRRSNYISDRNGSDGYCACFRSTCGICAPYNPEETKRQSRKNKTKGETNNQ